MSAITLTQAQQALAEAMAARTAVLRNQEYQMPDGRRLRRADLRAINEDIRHWNDMVRQLGGEPPIQLGRARRLDIG